MTDKIQEAKDWLKNVKTLGTKIGVLDVINTIERGLDALEKKPELEKVDPLERFVPEMRKSYFLVDDCGDAVESTWLNDNADRFRLAIGNCYRTREQAEKVEAMLRRIIELRGDFKANVHNQDQKVWCVGYKRAAKDWLCESTNIASIGEISFSTQEAGQTLIKEFGDELFLLMGRT